MVINIVIIDKHNQYKLEQSDNSLVNRILSYIFVDYSEFDGSKCMNFLSVVDYGTGYVLVKENVKIYRLLESYGSLTRCLNKTCLICIQNLLFDCKYCNY